MKQASNIFNDLQRQQVEHAVVQAESSTSCEIVPVVATSSGKYDRPEDMVGLWLAVAAACTIWLWFPRQLNEVGNWGATPMYVGLLVMMVAVTLSFMIGAIAGSRIGWLRRIFTSRQEMRNAVGDRARQVFFDKRIHHTEGATGLLVYLSLLERTAVILGDQTVLEKLGQEFLDELCQMLTNEIREGHPAEALCKVIEYAGTQLSNQLPRADSDVNEIQDTLILIDG